MPLAPPELLVRMLKRENSRAMFYLKIASSLLRNERKTHMTFHFDKADAYVHSRYRSRKIMTKYF